MKKLIAIGFSVLLVLGLSVLSHADTIQTQKTIAVLLGVDSLFGFEIWDTEYSQTLPNVLPGETALGNLHMYATSNHSIVWHLNASSTGLTGEIQVPPDVLPVQISTYGTGLTGTTVTDLVLTGVAQSIYTAGTGEYPVAGLEVDAVFAIPTQSDTQQDLYSGTIVLTMTE